LQSTLNLIPPRGVSNWGRGAGGGRGGRARGGGGRGAGAGPSNSILEKLKKQKNAASTKF